MIGNWVLPEITVRVIISQMDTNDQCVLFRILQKSLIHYN